MGIDRLLTIDVGGTSFDVGVVVDGAPLMRDEVTVGGADIRRPAIDVGTIGAGGGSIARVHGGTLSVGPQSAGATPGPVCYGRGGTQVTATDADLVLGVLDETGFAGGTMRLSRAAAEVAIAEQVAAPLGMSTGEAAWGIRQILDSKMADLLRSVTIERGHDPREFVMFAGGGQGPSHAWALCRDLGIHSESITPPDSVSTGELLEIVAELNSRREIHGILVQLPLPAQVDSKQILLAVAPQKDVDGFHPENVGRLVAGLPGPRACTPAGIIQLLKHYRIPIAGKRAVVVGRSDIVGKPVAMLLLHEHATVTICHSKTPDLAAVCREGDILVAAIGRPAMITGEFLKTGAVVIDVGTNRVDDCAEVSRIYRNSAEKMAALEKRGYLLMGDVHPIDVAEKAAAYSPVPGGVGPLTISMLMVNTVGQAEAVSRAAGRPQG